MIEEEKSKLRRELRQARREITESERVTAEKTILEQLVQCPLYQKSEKIALYLGHDGEPDPRALLTHPLQKKFYLPKIDPHQPRQLLFQAYQPNSRFETHAFGITELVLDHSQIIPAEALDLVVMPLVAFDSKGFRLGRGGGFYDHTFEFLHKNSGKPHTVGLAFECQNVKNLPHAPWDLAMDAVITEKTMYRFNHHVLAH